MYHPTTGETVSRKITKYLRIVYFLSVGSNPEPLQVEELSIVTFGDKSANRNVTSPEREVHNNRVNFIPLRYDTNRSFSIR